MKLVKGAWALLVGIKDGLVLMAMLGFFALLYAVLSASPNPRGGEDGALLLALDGPVVEQSETIDPRELLLGEWRIEIISARGVVQGRGVNHSVA